MQLFRSAGAAMLGLALATAASAQQPAQQPAQPAPAVAKSPLRVGDMAPDFTLPDNNFKPVKLSDYRGKKNVILAFYVLAFTGG